MDKFIKKNKLEKNIKILGFQSKDIVFNIRKQSNINICFLDGFSLIEACAAGNPVLAYDTEWHSELVQDSLSGFLIKENDIEDMVEKINYILNNEKMLREMGKNARELAFKNHNIQNTIKQKQNIFKKVIT